MKKISLWSVLLFALGLTMLSACGGGGGGGAPQSPQGTTVVMTLSTAVTSTGSIPANTTINSYDVTVKLPSGVTVGTMPSSSETGSGVVTASGNALGASIVGVYTAATGTFPATVKVNIIKVDPITGIGFNPGEFCKLSVTVAAGLSAPAATFFNVALDDATGYDTVALSTVSSLQTQMSVTIH